MDESRVPMADGTAAADARSGIAMGQPSRPTRFVAGALPDRVSYEQALAELVDAGIPRETIAVLQGERGAAAIAEGQRRSRPWLDLGDEMRYVERYREAAREGAYVIGVPLPDGRRELRESVTAILSAHGASWLVSRSRWTHDASP